MRLDLGCDAIDLLLVFNVLVEWPRLCRPCANVIVGIQCMLSNVSAQACPSMLKAGQ